MWEARATYTDGSEICEYFEGHPAMTDNEQQHYLEWWLISRRSDCTWYSVTWIYEEDEK